MPVCHTGGRGFESRQPRCGLFEKTGRGASLPADPPDAAPFEAQRTGCAELPGNVRRFGAVAQLGERLNGIQEVRGSIPLGSIAVRPAGRPELARVAELVDAQDSGSCGG